ncbi:MAG TPA: aminotransferase class I/II-fold pyridoxal phosphate-dependent enzyme [Gemmatimonadaceae bacterium]|nr:aminotransferase class I/II-fold pyridoxal phosphate-dependent enzyme [Gemmatimonadaceae bacterium]
MASSVVDAPLAPHRVDGISFGKIVQIREALLRAQANGAKVTRFESGDPSFSVAPHVLDAVVAAGRTGKTHYVPNDGIPELRRALAAKVREKNGVAAVAAEDVFVTNGAMHALHVVFGALLGAGDEVIIPDPMWTEVAENIRLAGGTPVPVTVREEAGFAYEPEAIARAITPATRAIFVNSPHNPTGAVLGRDALEAIVAVARHHDLWIVSDEAYEDVLYAPSVHHSTAAIAGDWADRVVTVFSFSKSHAMSGLRVGYAVTRSPVLQQRIQKLLRCTINGVNSLAQWGALAAVTGPQEHLLEMQAEYGVRRSLMLAALDGIPGLRPFPPQGAFYVWATIDPSLYERLGVADADALSERLALRGIGSAPGDAFGVDCADAIRFAFSCDTAMVREGAWLLRAALTEKTSS